jgi:hypothetical protein
MSKRSSFVVLSLSAGLILTAAHADAQAFSPLQDRSVVKEASAPHVYVIAGGAKLWVQSAADLATYYGGFAAVHLVPPGTLSSLTQIPRDGSLLKEAGKAEVYLVTEGKRRQIPDAASFACMHLDWDQVLTLGPREIQTLPLEAALPPYRFVEFGGEVDPAHPANHRMTTTACLATETGVVRATTRTQSLTLFGGFTGSVHVLALDSYDRVIGLTPGHRYGVDGTWVGTSDRTDVAVDVIDVAIAAKTKSIAITHSWAPGPLKEAVAKSVALAEPLVDLVKRLFGFGSGGK